MEYRHLQGLLQQDAKALSLFVALPEKVRRAAWEHAPEITSEEALLALKARMEI